MRIRVVAVALLATMLTLVGGTANAATAANVTTTGSAGITAAHCFGNVYQPYFDSSVTKVVAAGWLQCDQTMTRINLYFSVYKNNGGTRLGTGLDYCLYTSFCSGDHAVNYAGGSWYCAVMETYTWPILEAHAYKRCAWLSK